MTPEEKAILNTEITTDPEGKGYAAFLPDQPGAVVGLLNALTETKYKPRMITARGILSDYPGGPAAAATVLDKLDAAAASTPALKWAMGFLKTIEGLDIGHVATHGMLDQLALGAVITAQEANNLKALSLQPASRSEVLGLPLITAEQFANRNS